MVLKPLFGISIDTTEILIRNSTLYAGFTGYMKSVPVLCFPADPKKIWPQLNTGKTIEGNKKSESPGVILTTLIYRVHKKIEKYIL